MANLCTLVLRAIAGRATPATLSDLQSLFPGYKRPGDLAAALQSLKFAKLISWTPSGWMPSGMGRRLAARKCSVSVERVNP